MDVLIVLNALLAILGGILAASGFIVSKRPDAKQMIDKLAPYQTMIGVGLVVISVVDFFHNMSGLSDFFKVNLIWAAMLLSMIAASLLLGILFGMPQIMKIISSGTPPQTPQNPYAQQYQQMMQQQNPGWQQPNRAEQKLLEINQKLAPFQIMIGLAAIAASLIVLLYQFHILKYAGGGPI